MKLIVLDKMVYMDPYLVARETKFPCREGAIFNTKKRLRLKWTMKFVGKRKFWIVVGNLKYKL